MVSKGRECSGRTEVLGTLITLDMDPECKEVKEWTTGVERENKIVGEKS